MKWIEALKKWNSEKEVHKEVWCVPKKGSKEYNQVKDIMSGEKDIIQLKSTREIMTKKIADDKKLSKIAHQKSNQLKREVRSIIRGGTKKEMEIFEKNFEKMKKLEINKKVENVEPFVIPKKKKSKGVLLD